MRKNINFLAELKLASPAGRKKILTKSGSKEIATISEICKNLLNSKFPLTPKEKRRLCRFKKFIRRLASRKINYKKKKLALIQRGGFLLPLILSTVAPIIANLLMRKKK
jgi:hypothetical protein